MTIVQPFLLVDYVYDVLSMRNSWLADVVKGRVNRFGNGSEESNWNVVTGHRF